MTVAAASEPATVAPPAIEHSVRKYAYIDALRGYAVLLVITNHVGTAFAQLPYPLRKLTNVGWHGVQLFFLVSCVTLLMSWRSDERKGIANVSSFWLRRIFRIAPMYYLAAIFYFVAEPPPSGFNLTQLLTTFSFINAWHPLWIPTVPNRWMVVPGGWSIGVEFTFYFLFPLMVRNLRSLQAAAMFFVAAIAIACIANTAAYRGLHEAYGEPATSNFLYFWFPHQLPIFALGMVLFFVIEGLKEGNLPAVAAPISRWPYILLGLCALLFVALAENPKLFVERFSLMPFAPLPLLLVASAIFFAAAVILANQPQNLFINRPICALGEVSFSAYLLHFFVIHQLVHRLPAIFDATATGYSAIGDCAALLIVTVPLTFVISWITFRLIEKPMIDFGRTLSLSRLGLRRASN
jgi:peptidoglycan/LPS O-acetylase OafA/YrhL